jgi:hypothetical protein
MSKKFLLLALFVVATSIVWSSQVETNLLKNGNFKQVEIATPNNWILGKDVTFNKETNVITASGKAYNVLAQKIVLPAGKEYTVKIKARKLTNNGSLGALFLTEPFKGVKEHTIAWKIPLSKNFSDVSFTVTSRGIKQFNLYRTSGANSEIEIAEVALSEGAPNNTIQKVGDKAVTNLIKNPSFNNYSNGSLANWILGRNVIHEMSDNTFCITAKNNCYVTLVQDLALKANKEYTIVVKACNFGKDGKLGILPQKYEGKKLVEAKSVVWNHPLSNEYKDYTFTFKAPSDKIRLNFYRLGNKNIPCGIKIAKIILFEGK